MKEYILKYIELKPKVGYYELSMTFGLSLDNLFELLEIKEYRVENYYFEVYDTNGNLIYREHSDGYWVKIEYDKNNNVIYREDSYGNKYNY